MKVKLAHGVVNPLALAVMALGTCLQTNALADQKPELFPTTLAYKLAVKKMSQPSKQNQTDATHLTWIERIARINVTCQNTSSPQCQKLLQFGASDNALLVRDHALRLIAQSSQFSWQEKLRMADQAIADDRNYRAGRPLWIVSTAQSIKKMNP